MFGYIAISLIFRLIILQRARCDNNILILSILQLSIRSTVAIYSILPIPFLMYGRYTLTGDARIGGDKLA